MERITREKLEKYHKVYKQIFENPFVLNSQIIKNTGLAHSTVQKYLNSPIIRGPKIFLKPAENYYGYVHFLQVVNPVPIYEDLVESSRVTSVFAGLGSWNLLLICDKPFDYTKLEGFETCILQGVKGMNHLSKVTTLDWDKSMEKMRSMLHFSEEKTSLYKEIPSISWKEWEWTLYYRLRQNVRMSAGPILEELGIDREQYRKWLSSLSDVGSIQTAFYPLGFNSCTADFLFKSDYHHQLLTIFGLLPSTSLFFSIGDYLFARLSITGGRKMRELFAFIHEMKKEKILTDLHYSRTIW